MTNEILVGSAGKGKTMYIKKNKNIFDKENNVIICISKDEYSDFNKAKVVEINNSSPAQITTQMFRYIESKIHELDYLIIDGYEQVSSMIGCFDDLILDAIDEEDVKVLITTQSLHPIASKIGVRCRHMELAYDFDQMLHVEKNLKMVDIGSLRLKTLDANKKILAREIFLD